MATVNFYLANKNKQNLYAIVLVYQDAGDKFRYFTSFRVPKNHLIKNRVKEKSLFDFEINEKLIEYEGIINDLQKEAKGNQTFYNAKEMGMLFKNRLKASADKAPVKLTEGKGTEFFNLFDVFIEESIATKAHSTIKDYKYCKNTLIQFEKSSGSVIHFSTINTQFYHRYVNFLVGELKLLNNTVGSKIKVLKTFLNYVIDNELTTVRLNLKRFKVMKEDIDIVALTNNELFTLFEFKLPTNLSIARDYLCFECFTGLRFSDISRLRNENIKDDFIELRTQKTKDILFVPINEFAQEILDKYKGMYQDRPLPPALPNQMINRYIKDACEMAGINEIIMVEKFNGSNRVTISKPKSQLISTHTGRRTFITLSHESGMSVEMIMKITGIKKWDTLKKYLKVSEKSKLIKMNEFWNRSTMLNQNQNQKLKIV